MADGVANAFSPSSPMSFRSGAPLNVNFDEAPAGLKTIAAGGGTANIASGATLTINESGSSTFSGIISGAGDDVEY